jgi:NAD(P)-dependent dehydrogenase (short-subunit alcohol dehydrogenase family)
LAGNYRDTLYRDHARHSSRDRCHAPHGRPRPAPAYDAAKAGTLRLTTGLGWLGEKANIRVNCLAPGWIVSEQVRTFWERWTPDERIERGAPSRLLSLDQVADAVVRLATDESLHVRVM